MPTVASVSSSWCPIRTHSGTWRRGFGCPRYQPLAETTGDWIAPWGEMYHGGFSLCPLTRAAWTW